MATLATLVPVRKLKAASPCAYCRKPGLAGLDLNAMGGFYNLEGHNYHYFCILFR
jgi:hypothetical protein